MKRTAQLVVLLMLTTSLAAPPARAAGTNPTWTVIAGGDTKDFAVISNSFHPRKIDVAVGDTVTWIFEGFHTVSFLGGQSLPPIFVREGGESYGNPQVFFPVGGRTYDGTGYRNSGTPPDPRVSKPFTYSLTFTKPGRYPYVCIIHAPGMGGTVVVKERVSASPESIIRGARREQAATLNAGQGAFEKLGAV